MRPHRLNRGKRWIAAAFASAAAVPGLVLVGLLPPAAGLLTPVIVLGAVLWALHEEMPRILLVFLTCLFVMLVIGRPLPKWSDSFEVKQVRDAWSARGGFDDRLPAVLHLVFDEMTSTGAMTDDLPGAAATRQAFYDLGREHGLRTSDSVYSRSFFSGRSLPNLFNGEYLGRTGIADRYHDLLESVDENAYFDEMARRGYRTAVFQTTLLDFCANEQVDLCETFASYDASAVDRDVLDLRSRVGTLLDVLLRTYEPSYVARLGRRLLGRTSREAADAAVLGTAGRVDVQGFPRWFARYVAFIEGLPRGSHVFAHFMVPHSPYMLREDCSIGPDKGSGYYLAGRFEPERRVGARRQYYADYLVQLNCVRRSLAMFLDAVDRNPALHDASIIIHGDHGSRISAGNIIEDYADEDYISNYATYVAVRAPSVTAGVDCEFASLAEAFRTAVPGPAALRSIDRRTPPVIVQSRAGADVLVEARMPRFGCATTRPEALR